MSKFVNRDKVMQDCVESLVKLEWDQLLILNAQLSEHILNVYQHALLQRDKSAADGQKVQ